MIDKIIAKNFKSFKDLSLGLRPLTVLCGTNGSGKSYVMQLLLLLKENARVGIGDVKAKLNTDWINLGKQKDVLYRWADAESKCDDRQVLGNGAEGGRGRRWNADPTDEGSEAEVKPRAAGGEEGEVCLLKYSNT